MTVNQTEVCNQFFRLTSGNQAKFAEEWVKCMEMLISFKNIFTNGKDSSWRWNKADSPVKKMFWALQSAKKKKNNNKVMLTLLWDLKWCISIDLLEEGANENCFLLPNSAYLSNDPRINEEKTLHPSSTPSHPSFLCPFWIISSIRSEEVLLFLVFLIYI